MTKNVSKIGKTNMSVAVTGIAGPKGGTRNKPVGLVHHALATKKTVKHERIIYKGNRETVRKLSVKTCLEMALNEIN